MLLGLPQDRKDHKVDGNSGAKEYEDCWIPVSVVREDMEDLLSSGEPTYHHA